MLCSWIESNVYVRSSKLCIKICTKWDEKINGIANIYEVLLFEKSKF